MTFRILIALTCAVLLAGCAQTAAPEPQTEASEDETSGVLPPPAVVEISIVPVLPADTTPASFSA